MEQVIQFLEVYWGVSLVGGVTVGTVITFILVQLMYFRRDKAKNVVLDGVLAAAEEIISRKDADELQRQKEIAENEYLREVITTLFKSTSFLISASKLNTEDKLALQADFVKLGEASEVLIKVLLQEVVEDFEEGGLQKAIEENAADAIGIAVDAGKVAVDLISRYTKEV